MKKLKNLAGDGVEPFRKTAGRRKIGEELPTDLPCSNSRILNFCPQLLLLD
jgi:hypothetical protein